jgi:hypothetical protein
MPDHIDDIAIEELQIFDGDELIFDGVDPSTYIVIEPGASVADIIAALGCDDRSTAPAATPRPAATPTAPRRPRRRGWPEDA